MSEHRVTTGVLLAVAMVSFGCGPSQLPASDAGAREVAPAILDAAADHSEVDRLAPPEDAPPPDNASEQDIQRTDTADSIGEPDHEAPPPIPTIAGVSPVVVNRGGQLEVDGANFSSDSQVTLGQQHIAPLSSSPTQLVLQIPADFPIASCQEDVMLVVATTAGASMPASVTIVDRGPTISNSAAQLEAAAGTVLALSGCGLSEATVSLNGTVATVEQATATQMMIDIHVPPQPVRLLCH